MESPLLKWRKSLALTQLELANITGVSSSKISEVENGMSALGERLENFLKSTGEDAIKVIDQHKVFREYRREEFLQKARVGEAH